MQNDRPEMTALEKGVRFKTMEVSARAGMSMPLHHAAKETVIVVKTGEGVLQMEGKAHVLKAGDTMILPAMKKHSLQIETDFKAVIAMELEGEIQFESSTQNT